MRAVPPVGQLRTTIDPVDLRDSAAIGYAQALTALWRARDRWLAAATAGDGLGRARAARVLYAAGDVADAAYAALQAAARDVPGEVDR